MANKIITIIAGLSLTLGSCVTIAQEEGRFSNSWFMGAALSNTTLDYKGGTSNTADAPDVDLGYPGSIDGATPASFTVTDDSGMGFKIYAGSMFNEHFGALFDYATDPDLTYTLDTDTGDATDGSSQKVTSHHFGASLFATYDVSETFAIIGSAGLCRVTQNRASADNNVEDISIWTACGAIAGAYKVNNQFNITAGVNMSRAKGGDNLSDGVAATNGFEVGLLVSL